MRRREQPDLQRFQQVAGELLGPHVREHLDVRARPQRPNSSHGGRGGDRQLHVHRQRPGAGEVPGSTASGGASGWWMCAIRPGSRRPHGTRSGSAGRRRGSRPPDGRRGASSEPQHRALRGAGEGRRLGGLDHGDVPLADRPGVSAMVDRPAHDVQALQQPRTSRIVSRPARGWCRPRTRPTSLPRYPPAASTQSCTRNEGPPCDQQHGVSPRPPGPWVSSAYIGGWTQRLRSTQGDQRWISSSSPAGPLCDAPQRPGHSHRWRRCRRSRCPDAWRDRSGQ